VHVLMAFLVLYGSVTLAIEVLGHEAELDDEVGREVLRPGPAAKTANAAAPILPVAEADKAKTTRLASE